MNFSDVDADLTAAIHSVRPDLFDSKKSQNPPITKQEYEQVFYRLLLSNPVEKAKTLIKQLGEYLVKTGVVHRDENPGVSITRIKRPRARINVDSAEYIRKILTLEQCFIKSLEKTFSGNTEAQLGRLVFSAIRYGGLLRADMIKPFLRAVALPPYIYKENTWFELTPKDHMVAQIWNPDPLTLLLLQAWYEKGEYKLWAQIIANGEPDFFRLLKSYFISEGIVWSRQGLKQTKLLIGVNARLSIDIPASIVDCMSGTHDARSLDPSTYLRLLSGKSPILSSDNAQQSRQGVSKTISNRRHDDEGFQLGIQDNALLTAVGRLLRAGGTQGKTSKKIYALIEENRAGCTPIIVYLCEWVAYRLTHANRWGYRFRTKSAYSRQRSIARRLKAWCGASDLVQLGRDKIIEIYEEILDEEEKPSLRISIAKNLRDFHEFLKVKYAVEPVEGGALWNDTTGKSVGVDARIVMPAEYDAAWKYLYEFSQSESDRLKKSLWQAQLLVLTIGYRCGLRRREVALLRIKDITDKGDSEILVRPHANRSLKSGAAYRRIPLPVLMTESEQRLMEQWFQQRMGESESDEEYLFSIPELGTPYIDESLIFDHIQWLLKIVTGDISARFHHLRHSYGTWAFWRWMSPRYHYNSSLYKGLPKLDENKLKRERSLILDVKQGDEPTQKTLYALSMSIGHSGPSMSLSHYIHSAHWMLELELNRLSPVLPCKVIAELAGVTERQIQKLSKDKITTASIIRPRVVRRLKRIAIIPDIKFWKPADKIKIGSYNTQITNRILLAIELWDALQKHSYQNISLEELAERYNLQRNLLDKALTRAKHISEWRYSGAGHQSYRHRLPEWQPMKSPPLVFPYPRQKRHLKLVEHIVARYDELPESRKQLVQWGVKYFLENGYARTAGIRFNKKEDLKRFVRMLNALDIYATRTDKPGVKYPRFKFTLVSHHSIVSVEREKIWEHWAYGFKLKKHQCSDKVKEGAKRLKGYITLSIYSLEPDTIPKSDNRPADWGFRLGLYVLALVIDI